MQATEAAMVESPVMTRPYRPGSIARRAILLALLSLEDSGDRASLSAVADLTSMTPDAARDHLRRMATAGLVVRPESTADSYRLTDAGRLAAN